MTAGESVQIVFGEVTKKTSGSAVAGSGADLEMSGSKFSGQAIITSLKVSASDDSDATYSISLQCTGELLFTAKA